MRNISLNRRQVIAFSAAIVLGMLALLPGAWSVSAQETAGTVTATAAVCPAGFNLTADGACEATTTVTEQTFTGVTGTAGETVTLGDVDSGDVVQIDIPEGYPSGATFSVATETTVTMTSTGEEVSVTRVLSIVCTGNCTPAPVVVKFNLAFLLDAAFVDANSDAFSDEVKLAMCAAVELSASDCDSRLVVSFVSSANTASALDRPSGSSHSIAFVVDPSGPTGSRSPLQAVERIEAQFVGDTSIVEANLPPGDWGIEFTVGAVDVGVPVPADTGTGLTGEAGSNNVMWLVAALAAVAAVGGAGARLVVGRARR